MIPAKRYLVIVCYGRVLVHDAFDGRIRAGEFYGDGMPPPDECEAWSCDVEDGGEHEE